MDAAFWRIGKKSAGRLLDGKTHDAYSWVGPIDEDKANARLVAATPDLLEAVQAALLREDLGEELASVLRAARDKAVGDGL
jgi:DNA-binding NtrC family response regulator